MATWAVRPSPLDGLAVTLQRWGGHRQAGTPVRAPLLILAAMVAGCASEVRIQPLATGRPEVAAYQLHGPSLEALAQELTRLCPQGQQTLRQSQSGSRMVPASSRWQQSLNDAVATIDPPVTKAEMMVVCLPQVQARIQPPRALPPAPSATTTSTQALAVGPTAALAANAGKSAPEASPSALITKPEAAVATRVKSPLARAVKAVQPPDDELDLAAERLWQRK